jgi:hypothetical protein
MPSARHQLDRHSYKLTIKSSINNQLFSRTAIVKIIQPSARKLVCKKDGKMQEVSPTIAGTTAFWIITGILCSLLIPSKQHHNPTIGILTYAIFCFCAIAFTHDHIAIFDLDTNSLQVERYFTLFKKRHFKEYDLSIIRKILVEKQHGNANYIIVLKQHNGDDIYLPSPYYCGDILEVDAEAQKIRDFLGLNLKSIG